VTIFLQNQNTKTYCGDYAPDGTAARLPLFFASVRNASWHAQQGASNLSVRKIRCLFAY